MRRHFQFRAVLRHGIKQLRTAKVWMKARPLEGGSSFVSRTLKVWSATLTARLRA